VCAVEWEQYPASVLCARQNDGLLPPFPIWDDVQTFDGKPWRGIVDVVSGGFPCQDISVAGKGDGLDGKRSGMWREMARIIGEVRPRFAFVENSPMLVTRGLERVLADFTSMGYDSRWGVISAADIGAKHKRERIWILANTNSYGNIGSQRRSNAIQDKLEREKREDYSPVWKFSGTSDVLRGYSLQRHEKTNNVGNTKSAGFSSCFEGQGEGKPWGASIGSAQWWQIEPPVDRVANGMADRVDRLKAIGNGQVPLCAATAWELLK
jgi:DNA (cytosine-5)-methyltransferase 1